jgi:photosystem II stability/assembly factor-like uncharacterized protein
MNILVFIALLWASGAAQRPVVRWEPQTSGVAARLRGVSAVSAKVAWASGQSGTVLRTVDGGATWQARPVGGPDTRGLDFRDIDAVSDRVAWTLSIGAGETSRIYKTIDGGTTWDLQFANKDPKVFLDAMAFWDERRGVAFSDSVDGKFVILRTVDGGRNWARVDAAALPPALPSEGAFAASGTNVAVGPGGRAWIGTGASRILHSADAGRTWRVSAAPLAASASAGIFSIGFRNATHGIIVGGDYKNEAGAVDNVATTADGGKTWTLIREKGLSGYRSVVAHVPGSPRSWVAVGPSGGDLSEDDGRTWTATGGDGYDTLSFAPGRAVGWAAGSGGRIARVTVGPDAK